MYKKINIARFVCAVLTIVIMFNGVNSVILAQEDTGLKNLAKGIEYDISTNPRDNYPDIEGKELTDGEYGKKDFYDSAWQGHHINDELGEIRTIEFDLQEAKSIKRISANFLHYPTVGIHFPAKTIVEVSNDGENWGELAEILSKKSLGYEGIATQRFFWDGDEDGIPGKSVDFNMVYAQYVRVKFVIDTPFVFIDEIEIWGKDGKEDGAEVLPPEGGDDPAEDLPEGADYMRCGEQTSNINNLVLLYNHVDREWNKENILPYLAYMDRNREIKDWFFDAVLYIGLQTPEGKHFLVDENAANIDDWNWYIYRTFKESGDMEELNNAAKEVANELGDPDRKVKVFLMIPYPSPAQSEFGTIDGSDEILNFDHSEIGEEKAFTNRQRAVQWYINTVMELWNAKDYSNLELIGLYWLSETINSGIPNEEQLVKNTSDFLHEYELKHLWVPYFRANGIGEWEEFGFDMAIIQPNYYFDKYAEDTRLRDASVLARKYGIGIEMELDERIIRSDEDGEIFRAKYKKYLDDGVEYGYTDDVFKAYYQGGTGLLECARSDKKEIRDIYYNTYKFVIGEYPSTEEEPIEKEWVIADDIIIKGAANIQGSNIDAGISGKYEDDTYVLGIRDNKRRLEGFKIELEGAPSDMMIVYRAHVQANIVRPDEKNDDIHTTWQDDEGLLWKKEGLFLGKKGEKRKIEGVELKLINKNTGKKYKDYKIQYQAYVQGEGWGDEWIEDGDFAGAKSKNKEIQAIRIRILKRK